jgi:predicted DNA-binding transcriptional regulator YafY
MPINKLALIRYKTIDQCLQNRFRKWTLDDLVEACAQALYEYEGISSGVSRRTVQLDIQNMRSDKLGYEAPILVVDKKFYTYAEKNYSITQTPITTQDLNTLKEVLLVLQQFRGFDYFKELQEMVTKLEDKIYKQQHKGKSFIAFEKNDLLKGLNHLDGLHKAIQQQALLEISYQSFKARQAQTLVFSPYLLKEYRNRWFLLGTKYNSNGNMILALDRISSWKLAEKGKFQKASFEVQTYFDDVIGVSKAFGQRPQSIVMRMPREHFPYVDTKPLHASQKVLKQEEKHVLFSITVIWNLELEREIIGFGEQVQVISPRKLALKIQQRLRETLENYDVKHSTLMSENLVL